MNKFVAIAAAGALAAVTTVAATAPSQAFYPHHYYPFAAGVAGFIAGAAIAGAVANDRWYHHGYYGGPGWEDHVAACEATYRTYSPRDDAYTARIDSRGHAIRVLCEL
jgi:hypothetical protein